MLILTRIHEVGSIITICLLVEGSRGGAATGADAAGPADPHGQGLHAALHAILHAQGRHAGKSLGTEDVV